MAPSHAAARRTFSRLQTPLDVPNLIDIQRRSFERLTDTKNGMLRETIDDVSPITDYTGNLGIVFGEFRFEEPQNTIEECREKDITYSRPLNVEVAFQNRETGEIREQTVFMGDFPWMTDRGTFIINGTERVVVTQLVRSPGAYVMAPKDREKQVFIANLMPARGSWLELEIDKKGKVFARIDRKRKLPVTVLLRAMGFVSDEQLLEMFDNSVYIRHTIAADTEATKTEEGALIELFKKQRPGEPPSVDAATALMEQLFFDSKRYDLTTVGRYKLNARLDLDIDLETRTLTKDDIVALIKELVSLPKLLGVPEEIDEENPIKDYAAEALSYGREPVADHLDEYEHFGNRRLRTVGELIQEAFRIGLYRMERVVRERLTTEDADAITPQTIINIRPVVAAMKEFFGSSQLSQFMDQTNSLSGLTHRRRLSALGAGGLTRERAPIEVRDVHPTHYGRMCPIETPEGPNIGLMGSLASYAEISEFGFVTTPYRVVKNGKVTDEIVHLDATQEEEKVIAQANAEFDPKTGKLQGDTLLCRVRDEAEVMAATPEQVDYMDVSPTQIWSVATSLIPFLEHDDANRALMGSNMMRQAVPLLKPEPPLIGTGMERRAAIDSGDVDPGDQRRQIDRASTPSGSWSRTGQQEGHLPAEQVPALQPGHDHPPAADRRDRRQGQGGRRARRRLLDLVGRDRARQELPGRLHVLGGLQLRGRDHPLASAWSRTTSSPRSTSRSTRSTPARPSSATRRSPATSRTARRSRCATSTSAASSASAPRSSSGDLLVGKVTPKGETELTAEEKLIRAIFKEKAREVRDTSLKVPHGSGGVVLEVLTFNRDDGDDLSPGVNDLVRVFVATKRKIQEGDKLAGRHGNKGVISKIVPEEDMPHLADGTPVDVILNPLGVPSRMNIGQILETHLGWVAATAGTTTARSPTSRCRSSRTVASTSPPRCSTAPPSRTSTRRSCKWQKENIDSGASTSASTRSKPEGARSAGRAQLFSGRTGEPYEGDVTIGYMYILKLLHLVDDKIHARSTGPYSLVTQQPLGGKAQFGGQRFGEMEVWALEAYGAAYTLQEMLTVKSDDTVGRVKAYESIVKGENIPEPSVPESFKVLLKEMQALSLDANLVTEEGKVGLEEEEDELLRAAEELGIDLSGVRAGGDGEAADETQSEADGSGDEASAEAEAKT